MFLFTVSIHFVCYICINVISFVRFRPGSIIASLHLVFESAQSEPLTALKLAVKSNNFGEFVVDIDSIIVEDGGN